MGADHLETQSIYVRKRLVGLLRFPPVKPREFFDHTSMRLRANGIPREWVSWCAHSPRTHHYSLFSCSPLSA